MYSLLDSKIVGSINQLHSNLHKQESAVRGLGGVAAQQLRGG